MEALQEEQNQNKDDQCLSIEQVLTSYLELSNVIISTDVFEWWNTKKNKYYRFKYYRYKLSKRYLFTPARSASSERVFSTAGYIIDEKRTRLTGDHVDALVFLKTNSN
jgi:hypothetical protein